MALLRLLRAALVAALVGLGGPLVAQTLDEVDVRAQSDASIVRLRFNGAVRFLQQVPTAEADLFEVRFELVTTDEAIRRQVVAEFRRVPAQGGLPALTITYEPQANSRTQQLLLKFARAVPMQVRQGGNARSLEFVVRTAPLPPPPPPPPPQAGRFGVLLETLPMAQKDRATPIPAALQALEVVTSETLVDNVPSLQVAVGFFRTREEAESARAAVASRFPQARVVDLAERRAEVAVPVPQAPPFVPPAPAAAASAPAPEAAASAPEAAASAAAAPAPPSAEPVPASAEETERLAAELMARAREALASKRTEAAITQLNDLLKLPPNAQSTPAQELIGNAWEQAGSPGRARVEYELYLKLYPGAEGTARVTARLAALGVEPQRAAAPARTDAAQPYNGSIAQYYYGGKARSKSLVNLSAGIDQATLSRTTESAIVTSVDLGGRLVGEDSETRAVLRGSGTKSLIADTHSSSSISAAYVDWKRQPDGIALRAGRQSPISGGLLGIFDGVSMAMPAGQGLKVDLMGGRPAGELVSTPGERLLAAVLEADGLAERWGGNLYLLDQTSQGYTNRRALGTEVRYAGDQWSLNALADYDVTFRELNALSVHGSVQLGGQTTLTLLADDRRAPALQLTNALISRPGYDSLKSLVQDLGMEQVKAEAQAITAHARQFLVSLARPLDPRWQIAADLRYSSVGALPAVGEIPEQPATGSQYTTSVQLTGTNLFSKRDIHNFNLAYTTTPRLKGVQFAYNNLVGMLEDNALTLEPSIRLYLQRTPNTDTTGDNSTRTTRVGPGLRATWKASTKGSLLGELLYEVSSTKGPSGGSDSTRSAFFYVGYRYELF
ncbi:MAG: hypothetical protein U1F50_09590 [Rubrivivax sp.]